MNKFKLEYKIKYNSTYQDITKYLILPISIGQLLDERLDECYLTLYDIDIDMFPPLSYFRLTVTNSDTVSKQYTFVLANDKSERPNLTVSKYKHSLYLIEQTKLLEGIICQSLTFTNKSGNTYTKNAGSVYYTVSANNQSYNETIKSQLFHSPIDVDNSYIIPSYKEVNEEYGEKLKSDGKISEYQSLNSSSIFSSVGVVYGSMSVKNGTDDVVVYTLNASDTGDFTSTTHITISSPKQPLVISYTLIGQGTLYAGEYANLISETTITLSVVENKYPSKMLTVKDCIDRILDLAQPHYDTGVPKYSLATKYRNKFDKILAPEFSMSQCTLREQLKVIGGFINAEPRLDGQYIYYDKYGSTEKANIDNGTPFTCTIQEQSIDEYCTSVDTSAQNIVNSLDYAQGVVINPKSEMGLTVRSESINIKMNETDTKATTQYPIYSIYKVRAGIYSESGNTYDIPLTDITSYIFERTEYLSNLSSYSGGYPYSKSYAVYYTQGQKNIDGLWYKEPSAISPALKKYAIINILERASNQSVSISDYTRVTFQIEYIPIYATRFSHTKGYYPSATETEPFSKIYNQSENVIETRYYGENIKGVSARLGNVTQTRTYFFDDVGKIPKAGTAIILPNEIKYISAVNTEYGLNYIKSTVALSQDFNRLSQYVGINSNKRVYEVSEKQAYNRDILLKDYIVIGDDTDDDTDAVGFNQILQIANNYTTEPTVNNAQINFVKAKGYNYNKTSGFGQVSLPVISSSFGNSAVFSWNYKDNYSAGEKVVKDGSNYYLQDVPYGDYYGRCYNYQFALSKDYTEIIDKEKSDSLPSETGTISGAMGTPSGKYLTLRKDSREVLNFNYVMEFVSNRRRLIIGSAMAKYLFLIRSASEEKKSFKVYFFNTKLNKFETQIDTTQAISSATITNNISSGFIQFNLPTSDFESWAICTETGSKSITVEDDSGNVTTQTITTGGDVIMLSNWSKDNYGSQLQEKIYFSIKNHREENNGIHSKRK